MNSPLDNLLSRLENVRECGNGYRADCPIGHRSKQTLSVAMKDGMLLVHCHANCPKLEILHTMNLTLADLYERPTETAKTPRPSWQQRELMKMRRFRDCREDLLKEVSILLSIAGQAHSGYKPSDEDKVRAERAARILRETLGAL